MKVRGERECRECGVRWSYYETGSVECPDCGSLRSVGVDDRTAHTDAPASLDLTPHRTRFGDASGTLPTEGVDELKSDLREYVRKRGFVRGGELLPLDTTYLAARELLEAVDCYDRLRDPADADREYLLGLLAGADDGDRPATENVPERLREARGMAAARAVDEYRSDLLAFLDELDSGTDDEPDSGTDDEPDSGAETGTEADAPTVRVAGGDPQSRIAPARELLGRLRDRAKRVEALNGDVPAADADALVDAADALGEYVRTGEDTAIERARSLLAERNV
ncbi:DUF7117 family protein [Halorubrum depositum]|uniref:DUF7117 family protein n=1 Tax=Halorubrum depositum TaxID=2583992 RepID=UPI0011AAF38E|nr:hypothetical protein [Halorubrum depositum]